MQIELWGGGRWSATPSGVFALVDDADAAPVSEHRWYCLRPRKNGKRYAATKVAGRTVLLHRFLLAPPAGAQVDHVNGDGLDNRRENLRTCSNAENHRNMDRPRHYRGRPLRTQFKGVSPVCGSPHRFSARLHFRRAGRLVGIHLGSHPTQEAAARAYDAAALEHFGRFARLNFPASA